jgi:hypothetical protein
VPEMARSKVGTRWQEPDDLHDSQPIIRVSLRAPIHLDGGRV